MNAPLTLDEILAPSRIAAAWAKLRANNGAPGEDAVTIRDLEESLPRLWPSLEDSIRSGSYRSAPLRPVWIPKPDGGRRRLAIPSVIDRLIQHAITSTLGLRWESRFPKCSYAYRPGVGAHQAIDGVLDAAALVGAPVALRMDIRDFFDRIPREAISTVLRETPCDEQVTRLIRQSLASPLATPLGPLETQAGIPQGSPMSPLLSNAVLLPFDQSIASSPGSLFRYADDMLVLCRRESTAQSMLAQAKESLALIGLELNPSKTSIQPLAQASFLGFGFAREGGRWVRDLAMDSRNTCLQHLLRMEDSGKSPGEMAIFFTQWSAYFLPTQEDQSRHAGFLHETRQRFRLPQPALAGKARQTPPAGFSYSGRAQVDPVYHRIPWALRFFARRIRIGLQFRRRGFIPMPSGLHLSIGGHRIHIRL